MASPEGVPWATCRSRPSNATRGKRVVRRTDVLNAVFRLRLDAGLFAPVCPGVANDTLVGWTFTLGRGVAGVQALQRPGVLPDLGAVFPQLGDRFRP